VTHWLTDCVVCSSSAGVKTMVLLTFCDEGDNTQDACDLVSYLNTITRWIPPSTSQVLDCLVTHRYLIVSSLTGTWSSRHSQVLDCLITHR